MRNPEHYPLEVIELACQRQVEQGNLRNIDIAISYDRRGGGFNWADTIEGHDFWTKVLMYRNFADFFVKYPKKIVFTTPLSIMV